MKSVLHGCKEATANCSPDIIRRIKIEEGRTSTATTPHTTARNINEKNNILIRMVACLNFNYLGNDFDLFDEKVTCLLATGTSQSCVQLLRAAPGASG